VGGVVTDWYQSEVATMDLGVKEYHHRGLYVWHAWMMVNGFYIHCGI